VAEGAAGLRGEHAGLEAFRWATATISSRTMHVVWSPAGTADCPSVRFLNLPVSFLFRMSGFCSLRSHLFINQRTDEKPLHARSSIDVLFHQLFAMRKAGGKPHGAGSIGGVSERCVIDDGFRNTQAMLYTVRAKGSQPLWFIW